MRIIINTGSTASNCTKLGCHLRDKAAATTKLQVGQGKLRKTEVSEPSCQGLTELVQVPGNDTAVSVWLQATLVAQPVSREGITLS